MSQCRQFTTTRYFVTAVTLVRPWQDIIGDDEGDGVKGDIVELHGHKSVGGDSHATVLRDVVPAFRLHERTKRMFDVVLATMGLILFAPILLIASIAIKLDSRGPVLIRGTLYGYKNQPIQLLKFRLVTARAASDPIYPRPTRVGRILRQTGIDELAQLFNVLRGDISIVGRRNVHRWSASIH
jgi:lipopolysaccharide/colanic/teichoic acid biosynthesis glycosyltransferase